MLHGIYGITSKFTDICTYIYRKHLLKIFPSYQVINTGNSMAPNVSVEIMVPNSFSPQTDKLFNILDVQVKMYFFHLTFIVCLKY